LVGDLNNIALKYSEKLENDDIEIEEEVFNTVLATISVEELRESFGYCLLSSLIDYQDSDTDVELELEVEIQIVCNRLFRVNIIPNGDGLEVKAIQKARNYFDGKWKNFRLNYCQSFEEMEENNLNFVSEELVKKSQRNR
jgi:hypothetical protein